MKSKKEVFFKLYLRSEETYYTYNCHECFITNIKPHQKFWSSPVSKVLLYLSNIDICQKCNFFDSSWCQIYMNTYQYVWMIWEVSTASDTFCTVVRMSLTAFGSERDTWDTNQLLTKKTRLIFIGRFHTFFSQNMYEL